MKGTAATLVLIAALAGQAQHVQSQQSQASPPPCEAPKKPGLLDRMKQRAEQKARQMAQATLDKEQTTLAKDSHGAIDGTVVPSVTDVTKAVPRQPKPCTPAGPSDTKR